MFLYLSKLFVSSLPGNERVLNKVSHEKLKQNVQNRIVTVELLDWLENYFRGRKKRQILAIRFLQSCGSLAEFHKAHY